MRYWRTLALFGFLLVFGTGGVSAQEELRPYLVQTDRLILRFKANVEEFLPVIKELREKKDLSGLKNAGDLYAERWAELVGEIDQVVPPAEAVEYHKAFRRLCELQRESNVILSQTLQQRMEVLEKSREMKESGVPQEEIDSYVQENSPQRESLTVRTSALKEQTQQMDDIFKAERKRLMDLLEPKVQ